MEKIIDIPELLALPWEFVQTFIPRNVIGRGYPFWTAKGDTSAFLALFFDSLATQLALIGMAIKEGFDPTFLYSHFMGGVGLSIFVGNLYYSLQASKVAMRTGNMNTCAQPYGINTPGAIAKTFGVLIPAYTLEVNKYTNPTPDEKLKAMELAWSLACCANFLGGLFEFLGAFIAPFVAKNTPQGALLAPIGGVGMTYLGISPLITILSSHFAENPIVGFFPFIIIWISVFGTGKLFGKYVPAVGVAVVCGICLNLLAQTADFQKYSDVVDKSTDYLKWHGLAIPSLGKFDVAWQEYGSLVLGLACTNFIGTYACNISARKGGDRYSPMESMIVDGLGSMLGALFGSPYGTTVYIGHVTYKQMGATRGYSLLNGLLWLIFGFFGFHALAEAIIPHEIVSGVLVVVGFSMAAQCVSSVPSRWYPAVLVGLGVCFSDYMVASNLVNPTDFKLLGNGYIFISFFYTFLLMMLTDRWFMAAAGVLMVLLFSTFIGLIHAGTMNVKYNRWGTLKGNEAMYGEDSGMPGWKFIVMYASVMVLMLVLHLGQKMGYVEEAEQEDFRELQLKAEQQDGEKRELQTTDANVKEVDVTI